MVVDFFLQQEGGTAEIHTVVFTKYTPICLVCLNMLMPCLVFSHFLTWGTKLRYFMKDYKRWHPKSMHYRRWCSFHPINISVLEFILILRKQFSVPPAALQLESLLHFQTEEVTGKVLYLHRLYWTTSLFVCYVLFSWEGSLDFGAASS